MNTHSKNNTERGKVALVTGASSGIGQATAELLAKAGYTVYGTSRRGGKADGKAFEMLALDEAPHGAVNAAVALTRGLGGKGQAAAGMVNAVLRKMSQSQDAWAALPPQKLPGWLPLWR